MANHSTSDYPLDLFPSRDAWIQFWVGKHCTAFHPGASDDCQHCQEMIEAYGPMPPAADVFEAARIVGRAYAASRTTPKESISRRIRTAVFERDAYRCQHCGDWHNLTVDHIHPESRGGTLDMANLQTLCQSCNSRKGTRS